MFSLKVSWEADLMDFRCMVGWSVHLAMLPFLCFMYLHFVHERLEMYIWIFCWPLKSVMILLTSFWRDTLPWGLHLTIQISFFYIDALLVTCLDYLSSNRKMDHLFGWNVTALNEALTAEVQRLKLATAELGGESQASKRLVQQLSVNPQMYHLHHQQSTQLNILQQQQQQNGSTTTKHESNQ